MLYLAFVEMGIPKVITNIPGGNKRAIGVAETAGMNDEGPVAIKEMPEARRYSMTRVASIARNSPSSSS